MRKIYIILFSLVELGGDADIVYLNKEQQIKGIVIE